MRRIAPFLLATALTSCMVGPDYHRPPAISAASFKEAPAGWAQAKPADDLPKGAWWEVFNDPDLNRLEPMVAISNQTVAADYAAYQEARQIVAETQGGLWPTISLTGDATRSKTSSGNASASGSSFSFSSGPRTSGDFEGSISWTPDIWGKIRREVQGDVAAAEVSEADLANATLSAQATLATDYVDLRAADAQISLLTDTVAAYQRSLHITQNQYNAGTAAQSDVITARTNLEGAQSSLIEAGVARAQYEHAIAVLTGHAPADLTLPPGKMVSTLPQIPGVLPADLLQRRPDIAAAERAMAEQNAQIGVQVAAFYPDISLTAIGGFSADPITGLFNASNELWSLGSSATEDLFEGGARTAAVKAAKFTYEQGVATYRQTVLSAFQDVENDLSSLRILAQQQVAQQEAVDDAGRAVQIALNEYQAGTQAYTTVVTAQATLLSDQENLLTIQRERLEDSVSLIEDLGGGWALPTDFAKN